MLSSRTILFAVVEYLLNELYLEFCDEEIADASGSSEEMEAQNN